MNQVDRRKSSECPEWDAAQLFALWGIAETGRIKSARPRGFGNAEGDEDVDLYAYAARHVEKFFSGERGQALRPVAIHCYVRGQSPDSLRWRQPGETKMVALIRFGCGYLAETKSSSVPAALNAALHDLMNQWLADHPYSPPDVPAR